RSPGRRCPQSSRTRLRRWISVLLDVGGGLRPAHELGGVMVSFTVGVAMTPLDQLTGIAQTAEECGYTSIALPDSLFFMEKQTVDYPYTPDGSRMWTAETPWVDPLIAAASMGAATSTIRFYTQVLKLGSRNPVLLARQVGS